VDGHLMDSRVEELCRRALRHPLEAWQCPGSTADGDRPWVQLGRPQM